MKKYMFLSAALLLFTASCSNTDENNEQKEPAQTVQFSFTNEDFGEDETPSRATGAVEAKPQTIDLGDCEAEITVENEPAAKKTRGAQTPATGHYTIRAYQGGVLKGEIKGTFSGGTFTPDGGSQKNFILPHGTYDFVAFNDQVTVSGNELKVDRADVETARMGLTTVNINSNGRTLVPFTMKHVGARLRTQFVCQKHIPENITATLEATAANVIPASVTYNPTTKAYATTNGAMTPEASNSPASTETRYWASNYGRNYSYTSSSDYHYFLPTTEGSKLKLTSISPGTVFWKPIPAFNVPQLNATLQMEANKSYVVKIKLKPNYIYLMDDGTTDFINSTQYTTLRESDGITKRYVDKNGTPLSIPKIPIAVVLDRDNHMAIALKDVNEGTTIFWCNITYSYTQTSTHNVTNINDALTSQTTSGIDETWDASYSTGSFGVKATNPIFPAFKACAEYNPGTTYTGLTPLKWYFPSYSDWKWVFSALGFGNKTEVVGSNANYNWYSHLAKVAFTQVGATFGIATDWYWSSTEFNYHHAGAVFFYTEYATWGANTKNNNLLYVRPFVKY